LEAAGLDLATTRAMLARVAERMQESKDHLSDLDRAIGDGDHGIGMARGFEAVQRALESKSFDSVGGLLQAVGTALMMSIGGAAGAVFGTLFRGGGAGLRDERAFGTPALGRMLADGLAAVTARGGAKPGDKTMIDALAPAAARVRALGDVPVVEALAAAAEEARLGMERTKGMLAATGKAKTLGERALGHADPGAESTHLILKYMAEFATAAAGRKA
jgi:phosphoenolpyruvate---glycerone phosphotransferase subunit DhaL